MTTARLLATAAGILALAGCTDWAGYDLDMSTGKVPQLATMRRSPIPDTYEMPRLPAEGTVPVAHPLGDVPGPYTQLQLDSAAATLVNPLQPDAQVLARGQVQYTNSCMVCHGPAGDGKGPVVDPKKFPFAPPINGAATAGRSDGYIYAVIDVGRGLMPPYGERLSHLDRWAVVAYVRDLQRRAGAVPAPAGAPTVTQTPPSQTAVPPAQVPEALPAPVQDSAAPAPPR